jgi:rubrerythrin
MPSIILKITHPRLEVEKREIRRGAGPLFRGNGDTDYLCGNCGFVIVAGFNPTQHVTVDTTACPACSAINEFPATLRA